MWRMHFGKVGRLLALGTGVVLLSTQWTMADSLPLARRVKAAIDEYDIFADVDVTIRNPGHVELRGEVPTLYDKYEIFDIAARVQGVDSIADLLTINPPDVPDGEMLSNVIENLHLVHSILEPDSIDVSVKNGLIRLKGTVSYGREKRMAESVALWETGAKGIVNTMRVRSAQQARSDENIESVLGEIVKNRYPLDQKLHIAVHEGNVTVSGPVAGPWDQRHLMRSFTRVAGVHHITDATWIASRVSG